MVGLIAGIWKLVTALWTAALLKAEGNHESKCKEASTFSPGNVADNYPPAGRRFEIDMYAHPCFEHSSALRLVSSSKPWGWW